MITARQKRIPDAADRRDLYRALWAWTNDSTIADDLAQQTLLEAWKSDRQPADNAEWRPWLFGIARNVLMRWRRDAVRHSLRTAPPPASAAILEAAAADDDLEDMLTQQEILCLIDDLLGRLPEGTRQAMLLKYIEGLPQENVAARLGMHEKALEGRLFRGKKALRRTLLTERPDAAISLGIVQSESVWQDSGIWCSTCGKRTMIGRWYENGHVRFDCPTCDNGWLLSGQRSHTYSGHLNASLSPGRRRPSFAKALNAVLASWNPHHQSGRDSACDCPRCPGTVRPVEHIDPSSEHLFDTPINTNIRYRCDRCGFVHGHSWLPGQGLLLPEGQAFWHRHERIRLHPPRNVIWHGRPAIHTTWTTLDDAHAFSTFYDAETWRLLHAEVDEVPVDPDA